MSALKSIVMSGYYGFDNSGDDAILKAITKDLKSMNEDIDIVVLSNNPEKTKKVYNVNAVNRFKSDEVLNTIKNSSLLISGGGSLLQDVTSTRSLIYYLSVIKLAKFYKKPIMVYANGVGPIKGRINRSLTRSILNGVDLITLRDEDSREYVMNMGVTNKNIKVTADPVFTLDGVDKSRVDEIFIEENIPCDKEYIGVSIRKWTNDDRLVDELSKTINKLLVENKDLEIVLIPMHYPEDLQLSNIVLQRVNSNRCHALQKEYDVEEIMGVIRQLELIVAMRLHSLIYAATQNTPMVGLSYDPKVDGILKSLDVDHNCDVETFESDKLYDLIIDVWSNKDKLKMSLDKQNNYFKEQALLNVELALELLGADVNGKS